MARPGRARPESDRHWRRGRAAIAIDAPGFRFGGHDQVVFHFRSRAVRVVPGLPLRICGPAAAPAFRVRFPSQVFGSDFRVGRLPLSGSGRGSFPGARELGCQSRRLGCQLWQLFVSHGDLVASHGDWMSVTATAGRGPGLVVRPGPTRAGPALAARPRRSRSTHLGFVLAVTIKLISIFGRGPSEGSRAAAPAFRVRFPSQVSESGLRVRFTCPESESGFQSKAPRSPSTFLVRPSQVPRAPPVARELGCQPRRLGWQSRRLGCQSRRRYCGRSRFPSQVSGSESSAEVCLDCLSLRLRVDFH